MKKIKKAQQAVFNCVWKNLNKQGKPSIFKSNNGTYTCRLLDDEGNRCAIGHLLNNKDLYDSALSILSHSKHNFIIDLLRIAHDSAAHEFPENPKQWKKLWKKKMRKISYDLELKFSFKRLFWKIVSFQWS